MSETTHNAKLAKQGDVFFVEVQPPLNNCEAFDTPEWGVLKYKYGIVKGVNTEAFSFFRNNFGMAETAREREFVAYIRDIAERAGNIILDETVHELAPGQQSLFEERIVTAA